MVLQKLSVRTLLTRCVRVSLTSVTTDIIGDLVQEVRRLERELVVTQAKLQAAQEQLNSRESDGQ